MSEIKTQLVVLGGGPGGYNISNIFDDFISPFGGI